MADGEAWNVRRAGVFGNCRNLGILEDADPTKRWKRLKKFARALCARLWNEASFCRLKKKKKCFKQIRNIKIELHIEKPCAK